ncbi:MAG: cytochrome c3 family protein [Nitrospirota bacterium]
MLRCIALSVFILLVLVFPVFAVPPGKVLQWESDDGRVVFNGTKHAGKGIKCTQCHLEVFRMRHGVTRMTMKEMDEGAYCGACHDGKTSFSTSDERYCSKCHLK